MIILKGDRFRTTFSDKAYEVAGRWHRDYILMPFEKGDDECIIYSASEIDELLKTGKFLREWRCEC